MAQYAARQMKIQSYFDRCEQSLNLAAQANQCSKRVPVPRTTFA